MDIKLVKIVTGDLVVGKWDDDEKKIKDPAVIQTLPTQSGGIQMAIMPFGYPFDTEIQGEISSEHIVYFYKSIPEELKNKYLEASSNLTISSASDLQQLKNLTDSQKGKKITNIADLLKP